MKNLLVITGVAVSLFATATFAAPAPKAKTKEVPRTERPSVGSGRVNETSTTGSTTARPGLGSTSKAQSQDVLGSSAGSTKIGASCAAMGAISLQEQKELKVGSDAGLFVAEGACNSGEPLSADAQKGAAQRRTAMLNAYKSAKKAGLSESEAFAAARSAGIAQFGSEADFDYVACGKSELDKETNKVVAKGNCMSLDVNNKILCPKSAAL